MPFEFKGAELSQSEGRDAFLEVYGFLVETGAKARFGIEEYHEKGTYSEWFRAYPEEGKDFLSYCVQHDDPNIRCLAGLVAPDDYVDVDPDFTVDIIFKSLSDPDIAVRAETSGYYYDLLSDNDPDEFIHKIGIIKAAQLIRAVRTCVASIQGIEQQT